MDQLDNDNGDDEQPVRELIEGIGPSDEQVERYLARISYDWCETVRDVGEYYRESQSLEDVADHFGLEETDARKAVATYTHIFTNQPVGDIDWVPGEEFGIRYFRDGSVTPEELLDKVSFSEADDVDEVREQIRIFVGYVTDDKDLGDVNLYQEIPETPARKPPSEKLRETLDELSSTVSVATSLPALQISQLAKELNRSHAQMMSTVIEAFQPSRVLQETIGDLQETLTGIVQEIDFEAIRERQRIRAALQQGIRGFEPPQNYNPDSVSVNDETKSVGKAALGNFITDIQQSQNDELNDYIARLEYGLERYDQEDYLASTFIFLSAQDGFLDILSSNIGRTPSGSAGHYTYADRGEILEDLFPNLFGIDSNIVASQWRDFLSHRHRIMHGDPEAYFDENIASVSLIFLVLSLYTTLSRLGIQD